MREFFIRRRRLDPVESSGISLAGLVSNNRMLTIKFNTIYKNLFITNFDFETIGKIK